MSSFQYKAVNQQGQAASGELDAASRARAVATLASQGLFVTSIQEADAANSEGGLLGFLQGGGEKKIKFAQRAAMLQQLSVSLDAGLPLIAGLEVVRDQAPSPAVEHLADSLMHKVQEGQSLSDAMQSMGGQFTTMQVSMVRAGEAAGALDTVMTSLAEFAERDLEMRQKITSASIYPLIVLFLGMASILVVVTFVIPNILGTVTASGSELPLPTRILMWASDTLRSPVGIAAGLLLLAGIIGYVFWSKTDDGRYKIDRAKLSIPVLGTAVRKAAVARFARTLGTLTASGVQIVDGMRIVRDTLGNEVLAKAIDHAADQIVEGQSVTEPLKASGLFPKLLIQVIAMGEKTGRLDGLLLKTAETYEKETSAALQRVMAVLPAVFIMGLALVIGFILAATLLPLVSMDMG